MKTIWKYQLGISGSKILELPLGAEILTVQTQREKPTLWVLVDPDEYNKENRFIESVMTGARLLNLNRKYIGTFQLDNGDFIGHVFEILKP